MPSIPLGRSAYERAQLPPITLKNMYYEKTPANLEDEVALFPRPVLKQFAVVDVGASSIAPTMTSNTTPTGYVAFASSEFDSRYAAWKAFNGVSGSTERWASSTATFPQHVGLTFPSEVTCGGYAVQVTDYAPGLSQSPKSWTIEGSNDGSTWVVVDTQDDVPNWESGEVRTYALAGPVDYSRFRMVITANQGSTTAVSVEQLTFSAVPPEAGDGPINGLYRKGGVIGGSILALREDQLYRVVQTGVPGVGAATLIGTVEGSGLRMTAEGNLTTVVLTTGSKLYSTNGTSLTAISMPDSRNAFSVDALNNYFLVASDEGRFYWSAIGGTTFDALDYAEAESQPDGLMTLKVVGDELWLFGRLSVEVWQPTGDLDLPFQRIGGRIFGIGITARDTCQKFNVGGLDTVCWLGTDRRVYRTNPNPVRISDDSLEEKLRRVEVSLTDNAVNPYATSCSWGGHDFYILHLPGAGTFAYDLATGSWDEWTSHDHSLFRGAVSCVGPNAQPLIGDDTSNQIWELTVDQKTDGEDPVVHEWSGLLEVVGASVRCDSVSLDTAVGTATDLYDDPVVQLSWSDDGGATYTDPRAAYLGRAGQRQQKVMWSRCGMLRRPGRVFRWRTTEPVTVRKAKFNEALR